MDPNAGVLGIGADGAGGSGQGFGSAYRGARVGQEWGQGRDGVAKEVES